ncbi:MAG: hypothetical protein RQ724_08680 [Desulfuromonadales bacterium]|nr:hypothetical protein [Desulfuromonadales bacterium]
MITTATGIEELCLCLAETIHTQSCDGELPDFIVPVLLKVAENPENFGGREALVAMLLQRVAEYETFSNVCCEKIGFSLEDIHTTLNELRVSY